MNTIQKLEHVLALSNDYKNIRITARWDGCCHIETWYNGDQYDKPLTHPDNRDYLHVCDLREFIEQLLELEAKAKEHFGSEWPDS